MNRFEHALVTAASAVALSIALAAPAAAHTLTVTPRGGGDPVLVWVGGGTLPDAAAGAGLIEIGGGPDMGKLQPPAHAKGLNAACDSLEDNGNGVVDIRGPGPSCPHGV
jgi:hypothetical protein